MSTKKIDEVVGAYRTLRDRKKEMQDRHKEELAPLEEKMDRLESYLQTALIEAGVESMKTANGTVYQSRRASVKIECWENALNYIRSHELWHMLEARLAKSAVEEFVESQKSNLPGTSISFVNTVNVRK